MHVPKPKEKIAITSKIGKYQSKYKARQFS